jgi:transposase-like protein
MRDVEGALEEVFEEPVASKSTVSRVCEDTCERYRQWCRRRLDEHDLVYVFLDAIYLKLRPEDESAEGVLVCWGITLQGRKCCSDWRSAQGRATRAGSPSAAT